jgi:hypothetical protein
LESPQQVQLSLAQKGAVVIQLHPNQEPTPPVPTPRERFEVWDAMVEIFGYEPRTRTEQRAWGQLAHSLKDGGADREKLLAVAEWYHRHWPTIDLTVYSLEKWYSHFLGMHEKNTRGRATTCPECNTGGGMHAEDCSKTRKTEDEQERPRRASFQRSPSGLPTLRGLEQSRSEDL